jgi:hypothetical protein
MPEIQSSAESLANSRWRSAVQLLEWNSIVEIGRLEREKPQLLPAILSAIQGHPFPKSQKQGELSSQVRTYVNGNPALKEIAGIVSKNPQAKRIAFWEALLCAEATPTTPSSSKTVPIGIATNRAAVAAIASANQLPPALQTKYAGLIAEIKAENNSGISTLKTISPELAQVIVYAANTSPTGPLGVGLLNLEAISSEVARELIKARGTIYLNSLRSISPDVAKVLAMHNGDLSLNGLEVMAPPLAAVLAAHKKRLELNGLRNIGPALATELAKHEGYLRLGGVQIVTPEVVKIFAGSHGKISLINLQTVTPETESALADAKNIDLDLKYSARLLRDVREGHFRGSTWAKSLSPLVARELVTNYPERYLALELEQLSPATAEALAGFTGDLHFEKLKDLDVTTAKELAKHHGVLVFKKLRVDDPMVAEALAHHTGTLDIELGDVSGRAVSEFSRMPDLYVGLHLANKIEKMRKDHEESSRQFLLENPAANPQESVIELADDVYESPIELVDDNDTEPTIHPQEKEMADPTPQTPALSESAAATKELPAQHIRVIDGEQEQQLDPATQLGQTFFSKEIPNTAFVLVQRNDGSYVLEGTLVRDSGSLKKGSPLRTTEQRLIENLSLRRKE